MTQLAPQQKSTPAPQGAPSPTFSFSAALKPRSYQEAMHFCDKICRSNLVPKGMQGDAMMVAALIEFGERAGMGIFESLQNVAMINGKPSVYGDKMLALVRASGKLESIEEEGVLEDGELIAYVCTVKRVHEKAIERSFSLAQAKQAGLINKPGPWRDYPERMLQMRARSWALRDGFGDVLAGMQSREEVEDYAIDTETGNRVSKPLPHKTLDAKDQVLPASAVQAQEQGQVAPQDPSAALHEKEELEKLMLAIDMADTVEQLASASELGKKMPRHIAAQARQAFAAKQKQILSAGPAPVPSKADRILAERRAAQGEGEEAPPAAQGALL